MFRGPKTLGIPSGKERKFSCVVCQVESLRKDIEILSQNHERDVDRKDAIIQMLDRDLEEVSEFRMRRLVIYPCGEAGSFGSSCSVFEMTLMDDLRCDGMFGSFATNAQQGKTSEGEARRDKYVERKGEGQKHRHREVGSC